MATIDDEPDNASSTRKWDWERSIRASDLRPAVRHLLLTLATYMDGDGNGCYPSVPTVATAMGMTRTTVFGLKKEAEELGWLVVRSKGGRAAQPGSGGSGKTNRYVARIPATVPASRTVPDESNRSASAHQPSRFTPTNSSVSRDATRPRPDQRDQTMPESGASGFFELSTDDPTIDSTLDILWPNLTDRQRQQFADQARALVRDGWVEGAVIWLIRHDLPQKRGPRLLGYRLKQAVGRSQWEMLDAFTAGRGSGGPPSDAWMFERTVPGWKQSA